MLDEPTADLDPLNTYFVVSILANHAKKYNRLVLLTMSKPRSDIFPFLDRVAYLCLGELVYAGRTNDNEKNNNMLFDYDDRYLEKQAEWRNLLPPQPQCVVCFSFDINVVAEK